MIAKRRLLGLLAVCVACLGAMSAIAAGSALACLTTAIVGQGSSLQKLAQELWKTGSGCTVTYESTGSGAGRTAWGAEESGHHPNDGTKKNPAESGDAFIGTDEPLETKQLANLDAAAGTKGQALVIPVAQAAVAIIVNPPLKCTITEITNAELQKILNTEITEWGKVTKATGEGCKGQKITRVVRKDVSGTTYVIKTYLKEINNTTCAGAGKEWSVLRQPAHNTEWPEPTEGTCGGTKVLKPGANGGGAEAETVRNTTGAIGYANLADARGQLGKGPEYHWVKVENQHLSENEAVYPGTSKGEPSGTAGEANCKGTHYGPNKPTKAGADDNWSEVNGAHPGNGGETNENYPICTLTYDVALSNYALAGFAKAEEIGMAAMEYQEYIASKTGGQTAIKEHDYRKVEEAVGTFAEEESKLVDLGLGSTI